MKLPSDSFPSEWADFWRNPLVIVITIGFVLIHSIFVASYYAAPSFLRAITIEDGLLENASALMYFVGSMLFFMLYVKSPWSLSRAWAGLLSFGFFVLAGEEFSWGQRLFDFQVESVERVNAQGEFNIHNLEIFQYSVWLNAPRLLTIGSLGFGIILPILLAISRQFRHFLQDYLQFPVPHPVVGVCFLLSWIYYRGFYSRVGELSIAVEESRETTIALGFLVYAAIVFLNRKKPCRNTFDGDHTLN